MRRTLLWLLVALTAMGIAGCGDDDETTESSATTEASEKEAPSGDPVKIGVLGELSGPRGPIGKPLVEAAKLRVEEINADGGVDGHPLELVVVDFQGDNQQALTKFRELVEQEKVAAVIGPTGTPFVLATKVLAEELEVPQIGFSGSDQASGSFTYRMQTGAFGLEAKYLADALKAKKLTKVVTIGEQGPVGDGYLAAFKAVAGPAGIEIVGSALVDPKTPDMTPQVSSLKGKSPDAVLYLGGGQALAGFSAALDQLGWDPAVFGTLGVNSESIKAVSGERAEGWVALGQLSEENPRAAAVVELWEERFPGEPVTFLQLAGVDAVDLVAKAIELGGGVTPSEIHAGMQKVQGVPSALGGPNTTMTLGADDRDVYEGADLYVFFEVKDGELVQTQV